METKIINKSEPKKRGRKPKNVVQNTNELPKIPKKRGRKPKNIVSENNNNYVFNINNNNFENLNKLNLIIHLKINSSDIKKNLDNITPYLEDTHVAKSVNSLSGITIDRFIPLIDCIKENVQDPKHLIPEHWVRGGADTRSVLKNIDYRKECL